MGEYPTRSVNIADVVDLGERLFEPRLQPNPEMSILHIKWQDAKNRIPKPQILPEDREVGYNQEVLIQQVAEKRLGEDSSAQKGEENSQIKFHFTLNKDEVPTPFSGEFYDKNRKIVLSKELLGEDCKIVEIKVIAIQDKKLPSEVAYKRYELNERLQPKEIGRDEEGIIAANPLDIIGQANSSADLLRQFSSGTAVLQSGGADSVQSSPDLSEECNFFGTLS